jgi:hypothetical protein
MPRAITVSTAELTLTRTTACAGDSPSHDAKSTTTSASAYALINGGAPTKSRIPRCNASMAATPTTFPSARRYSAGSGTGWCRATTRATKLRVLSPAKADQCNAARRTSPITHDPRSQIPQNTTCITAIMVNAMSVAERWIGIP